MQDNQRVGFRPASGILKNPCHHRAQMTQKTLAGFLQPGVDHRSLPHIVPPWIINSRVRKQQLTSLKHLRNQRLSLPHDHLLRTDQILGQIKTSSRLTRRWRRMRTARLHLSRNHVVDWPALAVSAPQGHSPPSLAKKPMIRTTMGTGLLTLTSTLLLAAEAAQETLN